MGEEVTAKKTDLRESGLTEVQPLLFGAVAPVGSTLRVDRGPPGGRSLPLSGYIFI